MVDSYWVGSGIMIGHLQVQIQGGELRIGGSTIAQQFILQGDGEERGSHDDDLGGREKT
jgi:hypothetical protein